MRPIRVNDLKSAKRLLSKLILELQTGTIESPKAKDLCYLATSFVNIYKIVDVETRITELETRLKERNYAKN
jgi:hypothetical protein